MTDTAGPPHQSVYLLLSAQNIDISHSSESGDASTSSLPGGIPVPTILGEAGKRETSLPADDRGNSPFTKQNSVDNALSKVVHATEYFVVLIAQGSKTYLILQGHSFSAEKVILKCLAEPQQVCSIGT